MSAMLLLDEDRYGLATVADRRFRRIVARFGIPMLAFAIAVPLLHLELATLPEVIPPPRELRRVELLPLPVLLPKPEPVREKPVPAPPKPKSPTAAEKPVPAPQAAPAPSARALA